MSRWNSRLNQLETRRRGRKDSEAADRLTDMSDEQLRRNLAILERVKRQIESGFKEYEDVRDSERTSGESQETD